jgi:hypothetical protein
MAYAVSTHSNLHSLWLKLLYSNTYQSLIDVRIIIIIIIIIQVFKSCKPLLDFDLILFFDFHIIQLFGIKSLDIILLNFKILIYSLTVSLSLCLSLSHFCNRQIMVSITASSSKISVTNYT